jgi:hypothetical protein
MLGDDGCKSALAQRALRRPATTFPMCAQRVPTSALPVLQRRRSIGRARAHIWGRWSARSWRMPARTRRLGQLLRGARATDAIEQCVEAGDD